MILSINDVHEDHHTPPIAKAAKAAKAPDAHTHTPGGTSMTTLREAITRKPRVTGDHNRLHGTTTTIKLRAGKLELIIEWSWSR